MKLRTAASSFSVAGGMTTWSGAGTAATNPEALDLGVGVRYSSYVPSALREILYEGSKKARGVAQETLERVRHAVKLSYS